MSADGTKATFSEDDVKKARGEVLDVMTRIVGVHFGKEGQEAVVRDYLTCGGSWETALQLAERGEWPNFGKGTADGRFRTAH